MTRYKITYLKDTFENTEDTPVMDILHWTNLPPCDEAERVIREQRPDLLETRVIEYKGEPLDDDWEHYRNTVLYIVGDIVNWEEA